MGRPSPDDGDRSARSRKALLALTLAALGVRIAFLLLEPSTHPVADERTWTGWAHTLLSTRVRLSPFRTNMIFYPPLYPYFVAVFLGAFGSLTAVKWAQVLVGTLLVPAVGQVGRIAFGEGTGLAAAGLVAFYPELVWYSVHFWSETLFMAFLWWAMERLLAGDASGRLRTLAGAGALWALAVLTRETVLYFVPVAAVFLAWRRPVRRGLVRAGVFAAVSLGLVAPWTVRNWMRFHAFVPVSTAGGLNLYQGNAPLTRQEVYDRYEAVQGRVEQYQWARRKGIEAILDRQPLWIFEKLRDEMPRFWEADSLALIHIERGAYGPVGPWSARIAALLVLAPYLLVIAFFVAGLAALRPGRGQWLLLGFLAYYSLIHVVTHGFARYRLPALPVVFLVAAHAWTTWRAGERPRLTRWRRVLAAALAVAAILTLAPSLEKDARHPVFGLAGGPGPAGAAPTP
jgi:4-amino-4-deoxy-L-arabinose transferase-like glycosyltransferase